MKSVLFAAALALRFSASAASPPPVAWSRIYAPGYSGTGTLCHSMFLVPGGDVVTVGKLDESLPPSGNELRIWRHSSAGALRWAYKAPVGTRLSAAGGVPGDSGATLAAGYSSTAQMDLVVLKVDAAGSEVWKKSYDAGTGSEEAATGVARSAAGDIYVCGWGGGVNGKDYLLLKYNSGGELQWHRRYGGVALGDDVPSAIAAMPGGGAVITGRVKDNVTSRNIVTIRYDDAGNAAWLRTLDAPSTGSEDDVRMVCDAAGNVMVAGTSGGNIAAVRYDSSGTVQWTTNVSVAAPETPQSRFQTIALDGTGRVGIGSVTEYYQLGGDPFFPELYKYRIYALTALTPAGVKEWQLDFAKIIVNGPTYPREGFASMVGLPAGGFIAGGGWQGAELALGQTDGGGTMLWFTNNGYSNDSTDLISAMTMDSAGNLYLGAGGFGDSYQVLIQRRGSNVLPDPPEASATPADQIAGTSARLNGSVNPNGFSAVYHFEYGTTAALGSRTPDQTLAAGGSAVPVSVVAGGLKGATQYHFRLVAEGEVGTASSTTLTFTTLLSAYQNWATAKFGSHTAAGSGPDEDFDGDGVRNGFEYAFGGDPIVAGPVPGLPSPERFFDEESGFKYLSIEWQENPGATDIRYVPEAAVDLQNWTSYSPASGSITVHALPGDRRRAVARDFQKFMRLRLSPAP